MQTIVCLVKAMVFAVVMYGSESWTIKKTECWRTDAFQLWSPLDWKKIKLVNPKRNQLRIFTGRTDAELKLQYSDHLMQRADSMEKTLMLGNIKGRRRGQQRMRWLDDTTDSMDMSFSKFQELVMDREVCPWSRKESDTAEQLNWTELKTYKMLSLQPL